MVTVCDRCGCVRNDYDNLYGTCCKRCGHHIRPLAKPNFIKSNEERTYKLKTEVLNFWRNKP